MTNPFKSHTSRQIGLLIPRIPMGLIFICASISKFQGGIKDFVNDHKHQLPDILPSPVEQTYLYAIPFLELVVGILILIGLLTRTASTVASLMLLSFMIAITGAYAPGHPLQISFNLAYLAITLMLVMSGPGTISVDHAIWPEDELR